MSIAYAWENNLVGPLAGNVDESRTFLADNDVFSEQNVMFYVIFNLFIVVDTVAASA